MNANQLRTHSNQLRTHSNPFFLMAGLYLTVGLLALTGKLAVEANLLSALPRIRWLTIHFVTIGAMTQALFGALPHFVAAVGGATDSEETIPARRRWLQWVTLNVSYPFVLLGMATGAVTTAVLGATGVLLALALLVVSVYRTHLGSPGSGESADAKGSEIAGLAHYYALAPWFLGVGIFAAFGMLLNVHGPGGYFGSLEAHVHANVWGFLALVAAATLLVVVPRMAEAEFGGEADSGAGDGAELRYPELKRVTFWGIALGATGLVAGPWLAVNVLTMAGLAIYVVGTVALLANLVGTWRAEGCAKDPRFGHVVGAYVWLVFPVPWAPLVLLFPETVPAAGIEAAAIEGLVFGWMLQLAMGLLPTVAGALDARGGAPEEFLTNFDGRSRYASSWLAVAAVNLGVVALWATAFPTFDPVESVLTLGGYGLVGLAWLGFLPGLWRVLTGAVGESGGRADGRPEAEKSALD